ncbi:DUF3788 family protein [Bacteroidota bacterium]
MPEIVFDDKNKKPNDKLIAKKIGTNFKYWNDIKKHIKDHYGSTTEDWKIYSKNYGWQLKTLLKKRNLFFFTPFESYFRLVFVFGDKAVKEIENSEISDNLIKEILNAKKYAEGRGLSIEVKDSKYISDIKRLIEIKINN